MVLRKESFEFEMIPVTGMEWNLLIVQNVPTFTGETNGKEKPALVTALPLQEIKLSLTY